MAKLSERNIRTLWLRFGEIYGRTWESSHGDIDKNNTWLTGLENLDVQMLARGLHACISSGGKFPPNLPEFRSMCIGQIGIDDAVYAVIHDRNPTNPIVRHMRDLIGSWDLAHQSNDQLVRLAKQVYPRAVLHVEPLMLIQATRKQDQITYE